MKNKQELIQLLQMGKKFKYLYFWGHTSKNKMTDKSCLSQWFPASFTVEGVTYSSAEQYMMAAKARLFTDKEILEKILQAKSPAKAKALGRQVRNFDLYQWNKHCMEFVVAGNIAKFGQNTELKDFLLNTKKRILVEASPQDKVWGIGMEASHPHACNPIKWRGDNLLGFALMQAREALL